MKRATYNKQVAHGNLQPSKRPLKRKTFGKYIVADPRICHGHITFAGTRIFVKDVLDMAADGMDWDRIIEEWNGHINREAIAEALRLAGRAFMEHADEYIVESAPI
jgi:uncharacterized protein (DUF433 family)